LLFCAMPIWAAAQTPVTAIVEAGAARLETVTWGSGEPVIMLPGSGYSSSAFGLLGPELAKRGYRAIAVSPRGMRGSTGPLEGLTFRDYTADVAALIERVAGGRAHVLGWAWGNRIARTLATERPDRVGTITLIAAGGKFPSDPSMTDLNARLRQPNLSQAERERVWALRSLAPESDVAPLVAITESWPEANAAWNAAGRNIKLEEWWPGGRAPMLVVQGLQDKIAPPANGRDLKASYPDRVTLVEIDRAGHALLVEHPARIAEETAAFLRRHPLR
jgi:pimeloyl-ACP methyl ester carboxylesterase